MTPGQYTIETGPRRTCGLDLRDTILILAPGPRVVPVMLTRASLDGTVASNVLKYGSGGLDIDGCRVGYEPNARHLKGGSYAVRNNHSAFFGQGLDVATSPESLGRWPPNILLVHGPGCAHLGVRTVRTNDRPNMAVQAGTIEPGYGGGWKARSKKAPPRSTDGTETVPAWACEDSCPVKLLDEMSGPCGGSPGMRHTRARGNLAKGDEYDRISQGHTDTGTASRFFPQFATIEDAMAWIARLTGAA